jgi:hypothetical protein
VALIATAAESPPVLPSVIVAAPTLALAEPPLPLQTLVTTREPLPSAEETGIPITLAEPEDEDTVPPRARPRRALPAILAVAVLPLIVGLGWLARGAGGAPRTVEKELFALDSGARESPVFAQAPLEPSPPASAESAGAAVPAEIATAETPPAPPPVGRGGSVEPAPSVEPVPSVEAAQDTTPPAPAPAASGGSDSVAPTPLRKKPKNTYYPLGI